MSIQSLIVTAAMPIVKVLLISAIGSFLALDRVDLLGEAARKHMNKIVFFVFSPALVASTLAKTATFETLRALWFMPVNMFITFFIGSVLGLILNKITRVPKHLKGLIIGACSSGNMGKLPIIIVPAMCKEQGSPFGAVDVCQSYGLAYASLSLALGSIYMWSYSYNIIRMYSRDNQEQGANRSDVVTDDEITLGNNNSSEPLLLPCSDDHSVMSPNANYQIPLSSRMRQWLTTVSEKINLKAIFAPSTIGALAGLIVGMISPLRKLLIGNDAPLHVFEDSVYLLGNAAIPTITLILGANLLLGLKGSQIRFRIVMGVVAIRFVLLPLLGILIVRGVIVRYGIVQLDPLLQFVLLLQYAVPPAMNIGTMTQLFGRGQSEFSVILLWTYGLAMFALTLWCTLFLWLVSSN